MPQGYWEHTSKQLNNQVLDADDEQMLLVNAVGRSTIVGINMGWVASMNNTGFFKTIQNQYDTRAPVLQYNTIPIPFQY